MQKQSQTLHAFVGLLAIGLSQVAAPGQFFPNDFGQTVNAFQDDFSSSVRDPHWVAAPRHHDAYTQTDGVLRVNVTSGNPNHLVYAVPGYHPTQQEVLARIRINRFDGGYFSRAGIGLGVSPDTSQGINLLFVDFEPGNAFAFGILGRQFKLLDDVRAWGPPGLAIQWATNTWYWLRLRQTEKSPGAPTTRGKVWRADGSEPEPADWSLTWDRDVRTGYAGILGGSGSLADFDVDYFLLKAEGLPQIKVGPGLLLLKEPENLTVGPGQFASLTLATAGFASPTYQWQKAAPGTVNFSDIDGATGTNYTSATLAAADSGVQYRCVVSFAGTRVASRAATLVVDAAPPVLVAAKTIGNPQQVTVVFSEPISTSLDSKNFAIDAGVAITGVKPGAKPNIVELTTTPISGDKTYSLTVNGIQDRVGNEILPDSRLALDLSVEVPLDYGETVEGFQDDFGGAERNAAWTAVPTDSDGYQQANGVMKATAKKGAMSHLLHKTAGYDPVEQEVLARVRVTAFSGHPSARAGIGVGLNPDTGEGINLSFRDGDQARIFGRQIGLVDDHLAWGPPVLDMAWENQTWFWLRLRQTANGSAGGPHIRCKFWPADGTVPEPTDWQFNWDQVNRSGYAGILGPSPSAPSEFEVDYILIKAKGLPRIKVAPGAFTLVPSRP